MREKKEPEKVSWKKEVIKVSRAVIIFLAIYFSIYKLYHMSVKKTLNYDEVEYVYINSYPVNQRLNEDGLKIVVDCFNDFSHIKRNLDGNGAGALDYTLNIKLKNGEEIHMYPVGDTWMVGWHNMHSMSWLDAWGNIGADSDSGFLSLYYWGDSPELRELWDEVLFDTFEVE